jgi:hypothetical protein
MMSSINLKKGKKTYISNLSINDRTKYKIITANLPTNIDKDQVLPNDHQIANEFICSICTSIPLDPVKCPSCNVVFCKEELSAWFRSKDRCPMRCNRQNSAVKLSHIEQNILNQITIKCKCGNDKITFGDIKNHFTSCKTYALYSCIACGNIQNTLEAIEKHVAIKCPALFEICEYCANKIRKDDKDSHLAKCKKMCKNCS